MSLFCAGFGAVKKSVGKGVVKSVEIRGEIRGTGSEKRWEFVLKCSFIGDNYRIYLLLRGDKYVLRQGEK